MGKKKLPYIILSFLLCTTLAIGIIPPMGVRADSDDAIIDEADNGDFTFDGYMEMPWDDEVPMADPNISFREAEDLLVKDPYGLDRGVDSGDDFNLPAAWPYDHTQKDELNTWFDTKLTPLRNQGSEGTCWAHAALSLIENYLLFHNGTDLNGTVSRDSTETLPGVNYSELQLAYFYYHNNVNPLISGQSDNVTLTGNKSFLDIGGNLGIAGQALMKWRGAVDEVLVPYSLCSQFDTNSEICAETGLPEYLAYKEDTIHLNKWYQISIKNNPDQVKQAIKENGIVGISFHSNKNLYNSEYNSFYNYTDTDTNHAVSIVGWDDDFPKEYFGTEEHRPSANGAWLVRNSWMDSLLNPDKDKLCYNGYFWMSYEDVSLKDAAYIYVPGPADDYDNNYYYTDQIYNSSNSGIKKGANVFTINGLKGAEKEMLSAVIVQSLASDVNYTISIYSVDSEGKPLEPITEGYEATEGTIVFSGIYTIPLNQPVILEKGTKYAIVFETFDKAALGVEHNLSSSEKYTVTVSANPGESFYYGSNTWKDLAELEATSSSWYGYGNLCIQALTTDIGTTSEKNVTGIKIKQREKSSVTIEWDSLGGSTTYNVYRSLGSLENEDFTKIASNLALATYTDKNLPANSHCYYRVVPVLSGQEKTKLASRTIATILKPSDNASMTVTIETQYTGFGGKKAVYGKTCEGADGYVIRYRKAGSSNWTEADTGTIKSNGINYWVFYTGILTPGRYDFSVKPFFLNAYGERGYGASTEEKTFIAFYPAPEKLTAQYKKSQKTVTLKWTPVEGATEYKVFSLKNDSGTTVHTTLGITSECTFVHKNVNENTTYRYAVYVLDRTVTDGSFPEEYCWKYAIRVELELFTDSTLPEVLLGDVDGDGTINAMDVTTLRRFLTGKWSNVINEPNSDMDQNGIIDPRDVTLLKRALAGGWGIILE